MGWRGNGKQGDYPVACRSADPHLMFKRGGNVASQEVESDAFGIVSPCIPVFRRLPKVAQSESDAFALYPGCIPRLGKWGQNRPKQAKVSRIGRIISHCSPSISKRGQNLRHNLQSAPVGHLGNRPPGLPPHWSPQEGRLSQITPAHSSAKCNSRRFFFCWYLAGLCP
jgi:hypothetical protein